MYIYTGINILVMWWFHSWNPCKIKFGMELNYRDWSPLYLSSKHNQSCSEAHRCHTQPHWPQKGKTGSVSLGTLEIFLRSAASVDLRRASRAMVLKVGGGTPLGSCNLWSGGLQEGEIYHLPIWLWAFLGVRTQS